MSKLDKLANILYDLKNISDNEDLFFDPSNIDTDTSPRRFTKSHTFLKGGADDDAASGSSSTPEYCYMIVPDSGYNTDLKKLKCFVYGAVHEALPDDKLPILFDQNNATTLVNKLVAHVKTHGTLHGKDNCPYPVGGFVVVKCKMGGVSVATISDAVIYSGDGKRDYSKLSDKTSDVIMYTMSGVTHGVINKSALSKLTLEGVKYAHKFDIPEHVKTVLLNNTCPGLGESCVKTLHAAWNSSGSDYVTQEGGDYTSKYLEEKAKYRRLKALYNKQYVH